MKWNRENERMRRERERTHIKIVRKKKEERECHIFWWSSRVKKERKRERCEPKMDVKWRLNIRSQATRSQEGSQTFHHFHIRFVFHGHIPFSFFRFVSLFCLSIHVHLFDNGNTPFSKDVQCKYFTLVF